MGVYVRGRVGGLVGEWVSGCDKRVCRDEKCSGHGACEGEWVGARDGDLVRMCVGGR